MLSPDGGSCLSFNMVDEDYEPVAANEDYCSRDGKHLATLRSKNDFEVVKEMDLKALVGFTDRTLFLFKKSLL